MGHTITGMWLSVVCIMALENSQGVFAWKLIHSYPGNSRYGLLSGAVFLLLLSTLHVPLCLPNILWTALHGSIFSALKRVLCFLDVGRKFSGGLLCLWLCQPGFHVPVLWSVRANEATCRSCRSGELANFDELLMPDGLSLAGPARGPRVLQSFPRTSNPFLLSLFLGCTVTHSCIYVFVFFVER